MFVDNDFELSLLDSIDKNTVIEFRCKHCNKLALARYCVFDLHRFSCKSCNQKLAFANKDWTERYIKAKQTKLQRYGDAHFANRQQAAKTCLVKYGATVAVNSPEIQQKIQQRNLIKYGTKHYFASDAAKNLLANIRNNKTDTELLAIKLKRQNTCLQKYNATSVVGSEYFKNKSMQTCLQRGYVNGGSSYIARKKMHKKYEYNGLMFDSAPELAAYIYLTDTNSNFEYQPNVCFEYEYDNVIHKYYPDFKIDKEFVEIKGLQFFVNKDPTNKMINPFDRSQDALYEAKHQCMLRNNVRIITDYSIYENYVNSTYTSNFLQLFRRNLQFPYPQTDIIKQYHHSIYHAHKENCISPFDAWHNKKLILASALNRLKYKQRCTPADILQGFNVAKIAPKVSVFKRSVAKHLVETYLQEFDTVFDPFSGFSGRMLGTCDCNKTYIGQDINQIHVDESNAIINDFKLHATVNCKDIFASTGEYECLFTCSPYSLKEQWNEHETDKSCDEWIDECLKRFKCKRYLFVVDETEKYKDCIIETLTNTSHFGSNNEYVILIDMTY